MTSTLRQTLSRLVWRFGLLFLLHASPVLAGYKIVDVGVISGGLVSVGNGIAPSGLVAGSSTVPTGDFHAFRGAPGGPLQDLGTLSGGKQSYGMSINSSGRVAGYSDVRLVVNGHPITTTHGFLDVPGKGMSDLGALPGGMMSVATAINGTGTVVGYSSISGTSAMLVHAFRTRADGSLQDLGTLFNGLASVAEAINDHGDVTGTGQTLFGASRAFRYTDTGGMTSLGTLPGGSMSMGLAINNIGRVVGAADDGGGILHPVATIGTTNRLTDLGLVRGSVSGVATGLNDLDEIVGRITMGNGSTRAFLYSETHGMVDLNEMLSPGSGWILTSANGVNNQGQITGSGLYHGQEHAFLLVPVPEPSSLVLLAGGATLLGLSRILRRLRRR